MSAKSGAKHTLPVASDGCSYTHGRGVEVTKEYACIFPDGSTPSDFEEQRNCVEENRCHLTAGDEQQMVIFRDPRSVAVSTYYWNWKYNAKSENPRSIDDYALGILPILCQWISIRYVLFLEYLAEQSAFFWYEDMKTNPIEFHRRCLAFVGLHLPESELEIAAEIALSGDFDFGTKGLDDHHGASTEHRNTTNLKDELTEETLVEMDRILEQWLPPPFPLKLDIPSM